MQSIGGYNATNMPTPGKVPTPDHIYIILTPKSLTQPSKMSTRLKLELKELSAYFPVYINYLDAVNDYPNDQIHSVNLTEIKRKPSEQLIQQMAFTPYVFENVGNFIDNSNPELYLFSSDYPHVEGGKDPIGRFEASLGDRSEEIRNLFYTENFLRIFPEERV